MTDLIAYIVYALLALCGFGFVIAIHELGHFLFAKWAGVRVDVFSIGFGPVVLRRHWRGTDYVLSLLPLGGYVKMLGQEDVPSGTEQNAVDPASYLAKSAGWKAMILLGGVLFNLISSYLILLGLVVWGMPVIHPVVGDVFPQVIDHRGIAVESPAARLGLERGDRIVAVDGERVRAMDDVMTAVIFAGGRTLTVEVERGPERRRLLLPAPGQAPVEPVFDGRFGRPSLGIDMPDSGRAVLVANAPADGIRRFDRIVSIAGADVSGLIGQDLQDRLLAHFAVPTPVTVLRDGERVDLTLTYAGDGDAFDTQAGLPVVVQALPEGPARAAGVQVGDWVLAVDGIAVCGRTHFLALVRAAIDRNGGCALAVQRGGERLEIPIRAARSFGVGRIGIVPRAIDAGVVAVLPPALDGGPSQLQRLGVVPGDALVSWRPGERDVAIAWVSGGQALRIPLGLDETGWREANRWREPSLAGKIMGAQAEPGLSSLLTGVRVVELHPTAAVLQPLDGQPRTVAQATLGPAMAALQVGDWIADVRMGPAGAEIEVVRGAGEAQRGVLTAPGLGTTIVFLPEDMPYQAASVGDALGLVNAAAYNLVVKSVQLLPRLFRAPEAGGVDPNKSLMGPIGIFREMKARAELMGFDSFLKLVALVGLNLFIVNLLPIPITDGGQLLMLGIETAIRRPLPVWLRNGLMYLGIVLVGMLFVYICGLDILRWIGIA